MSKNKLIIVLAGLCLISAVVLVPQALNGLINHLGGAWEYPPEDAEWLMSESAQALVEKAYEGLPDNTEVVDRHVQLLSSGQRSGEDFSNDSYINTEFLSWWFPRTRFRSRVLFSAAGIDDAQHADDLYLGRLLRQARALPRRHRLALAALDQRYNRAGDAQPEQTAFYVDNDYVWHLAEQYPQRFTPVVSVHPYRKDAIEALEKWAKRGVKVVKWLPTVQGIDPADKRIENYYQTLIDNNMVLLAGTGEMRTMGSDTPEYGNPLRYRRALEMGVTVVMADCAGTRLFSNPQDADAQPRPGYEWFMQLLSDSDYAENLYGDIAGLTHKKAVPEALNAMLQSPQTFSHLLYSSDYPLLAINTVVNLKELKKSGFITQEQVPDLREIYRFNPLLFDFVLKRLVRLPETDLGFPAEVFIREVSPGQ